MQVLQMMRRHQLQPQLIVSAMLQLQWVPVLRLDTCSTQLKRQCLSDPAHAENTP